MTPDSRGKSLQKAKARNNTQDFREWKWRKNKVRVKGVQRKVRLSREVWEVQKFSELTLLLVMFSTGINPEGGSGWNLFTLSTVLLLMLVFLSSNKKGWESQPRESQKWYLVWRMCVLVPKDLRCGTWTMVISLCFYQQCLVSWAYWFLVFIMKYLLHTHFLSCYSGYSWSVFLLNYLVLCSSSIVCPRHISLWGN